MIYFIIAATFFVLGFMFGCLFQRKHDKTRFDDARKTYEQVLSDMEKRVAEKDK